MSICMLSTCNAISLYCICTINIFANYEIISAVVISTTTTITSPYTDTPVCQLDLYLSAYMYLHDCYTFYQTTVGCWLFCANIMSIYIVIDVHIYVYGMTAICVAQLLLPLPLL